MAAKRQEEKKRVEDKEEGSSSRGRKEDFRDPDVLGSKRLPKSSNDVTGECWTGPALQGISCLEGSLRKFFLTHVLLI